MHKKSKRTKVKTNEERLLRIQEICIKHIGPVRSVSLKVKGSLWTATLKMEEGELFDSIVFSDIDAETASKGLKNRLKKIINRYNHV